MKNRNAILAIQMAFPVAACAAFLLVGCGSDSGAIPVTPEASASVPTPIPSTAPVSRYVGVWSGPFTLSTGQTGLAEITIAEDGTITGRAISTTAGSTSGTEGPFEGKIDLGSSDASISILYNNILFAGTGSFTLEAAPSSADDQLRGTLTRFINGVARGSVTVTLKRGLLKS